MAVVATIAAEEYDDQRGLISALKKRRSALVARINGIMRRSTRKSAEKNAEGKTLLPNNNKGYYQYQLDDNHQVLDTYTYYDDEKPGKPGTETNTNTEKKDEQRDNADYDENHGQQQTDNFYQTNQPQNNYVAGEYVNEIRRPLSSFINRITSFFGGTQLNMDETRSVQLTNLINEQIDIDNHIRYIQSTGQGRDVNAEESFLPLQLSRSKIGEHYQQPSAGPGVFIPVSYVPTNEHKNKYEHYDHHPNTYTPIYETSKPQGWVVKPVQPVRQVYYPSDGYYTYQPTYKPSYPIYYKPKDPTQPQEDHELEWSDVPRPDEEDAVKNQSDSLKEKLESIENQIEYIKVHTDPTAGNRPYILYDLQVQAQELRNRIKRIEYALATKTSPYYKK